MTIGLLRLKIAGVIRNFTAAQQIGFFGLNLSKDIPIGFCFIIDLPSTKTTVMGIFCTDLKLKYLLFFIIFSLNINIRIKMTLSGRKRLGN